MSKFAFLVGIFELIKIDMRMASVTLSVRVMGRDALSIVLMKRQVSDIHTVREDFDVADIEPERACRRMVTKKGTWGASEHKLQRLERTIEDWLGTPLCMWQQE